MVLYKRISNRLRFASPLVVATTRYATIAGTGRIRGKGEGCRGCVTFSLSRPSASSLPSPTVRALVVLTTQKQMVRSIPSILLLLSTFLARSFICYHAGRYIFLSPIKPLDRFSRSYDSTANEVHPSVELVGAVRSLSLVERFLRF